MTLPEASGRVDLLLDSGRYADALALLRPLLATYPDQGSLWQGAARAHLGLREWDAALSAAHRVVVLDPVVPVGHLFASIALSGMGRFSEALDAALQARRLAPGAWIAHSQVAEAASRVKGSRELAWQSANRAVELGPNESMTHATMGLVAMRTGRMDVAEQALTAALAIDPSNHQAQHNLGIVRISHGDIVGAAQDLSVSAVADPGAPELSRAFQVLVLRWLQRTHWLLCGTWMAARLATITDTGNVGLWPPLIAVAVIAAVVFVWWTHRTIVALGGRLRRVLWQVVRHSFTAGLWFACVVLGSLCLLWAAGSATSAARDNALTAMTFTLVGGWLASWLDVIAARRSERRRRS